MRFYEALSGKGKQNWPQIYERLTGKKWENPTKDKRGIICETKLEDLEEIDHLMRQKANPTRRE